LCHWKALEINNERLVINEELCRGCGLCVKKCTAEVLGLEIKE
jgi:heterodisulfide reductase subunit A-like polyferredoxin